ncbi:MerR family transcriptional regulator [Hydrogenophaga crassostreae]|uniref:MerR family transcriptional regulator n=1 Tax=Hydrogenophaga crassostreae TaxID=1763535 RepID=A0A167GSI1_9BURK|nr:MerR family transcriptional regulator [Hydrogenophaga crassostreae]AOW11728.1 MerR family transcriptional regulator [Hydrogenophaga crassostreae]OAD39820.1 MerR family transcriptional regulator [Hydrogenophaga crassostreae]
MSKPLFNIATVERDVGLSKDVLRVWERRYGFPSPERDAHGERLYPFEQVERLRLLKRLMDQGHRPGRLMALPEAELAALVKVRPNATEESTQGNTGALDAVISLIKNHDATGFDQALQQRLAKEGLQRFVQDTMAPLTSMIGQAWEDGSIEVYEEHLFTELSNRLLRKAISGVPGGQAPRVMLTTLPDEPHGLGLLMVESALSLEGAHCIPLGTQMPLMSIVDAARAHRADVVALSFSAAFPARQIPPLLQQLHGLLPEGVVLWAGGAGVGRLAQQSGVRLMVSLAEVQTAAVEWQAAAKSVTSTQTQPPSA